MAAARPRAVAMYAKAITASVVAFTGGMAIATADNHLAQAEVWTVISATVAAGAAVLGVPNAAKQLRRPKPRRRDPQE